jgi:hypothetical protein
MCFEFESLKRRNQYCSVMQSDSRICIRAQNNVSFIHFYLHFNTSMSSSSVSSSSLSFVQPGGAGNVCPDVPAAIVLHTGPPPAPDDGESQDFLDNYDLGAEGGDEYTLSQKMSHYCRGTITQDHWPACKAVLCFRAGTATSKLTTMTKVLKEAAMLELYLVSINRLDPRVFRDGSRAFFKRSFRKKEEQVSPEHLYCYFLDSRRTMRNVILSVFPKNLVSMKSGKGFHESCNEVYATAYRQVLLKLTIRGVPKYTPAMVSNMHPPPLWKFSKLPWYLGLAVKIFRRDPHLSPYVADVMNDISNVPISRAALKRQKQMENMEERQQRPKHSTPTTYSSSNGSNKTPGQSICFVCFFVVRHHCFLRSVTTSSVSDRALIEGNTTSTSKLQYNAPRPLVRKSREPTVSQEKLLWAKMASTKILAQNSNIAKRMGKMEELEKAMVLLDKMRSSIGEAEYGTRVQHALAAFTAFDTYDATVNAPIVIDLVDDKNHGRNDDDDDCVMVSVRPRTITGTTLAYETPTRPSNAEDNTCVDDEPADIHHIVVCQGNPFDKKVFPDDSDDDHDDRTPGPVVFKS